MNSELGSWNNDDYERGARAQHLDDVAVIKRVPSVQSEPLTDKEQRIFLAAMGREYKICKKVDEEYYGIDNINLVRVCREIERKVKKALWKK